MLTVMGNSANRVASTHTALNVRNILAQYRRIYLLWLSDLITPGSPTKSETADLKKRFKTVNTKDQAKYAGVIKPLAKTEDPDLYNLIWSLFDPSEMASGPKAKSTAIFNGMNSKWKGYRIPTDVRIRVLEAYRCGKLQLKEMKSTWDFEWNCVLFQVYVNMVLALGTTDFSEALAVLPVNSHHTIRTELRKGKIQTRQNLPLKMPVPIAELIEKVKKDGIGRKQRNSDVTRAIS